MNPNFATPYAYQYDFQVRYQFARDWLADAAYVGSQGRKLENRRDINYAVLMPVPNNQNEFQRSVYNINNPQDAAFGGAVFGPITDQLSDATCLEKRFSKGLQLTNSYTWSHCIDDGSGLRVNSNLYSANYDRGNCDTDLRHRYVGSVLYDLPFVRGQRASWATCWADLTSRA